MRTYSPEQASNWPQNSFKAALEYLTGQKSHIVREYNKHNAALLLYELSCNPENEEAAAQLEKVVWAEDDDVRESLFNASVDALTNDPAASRGEFLRGLGELIEGFETYSLSQTINALRIAYSLGESQAKLQGSADRLLAMIAERAPTDDPSDKLATLIKELLIFYDTLPKNEPTPNEDVAVERRPEIFDSTFSPILTHILEQRGTWDERLGNLSELIVLEQLYNFCQRPGQYQTDILYGIVYETEDEKFIEQIEAMIKEEGEFYPRFLKAFTGSIANIHTLKGTNTPDYSSNIRAIQAAYSIRAWDLSDAVELLRIDTRDEPADSEKSGWFALRREINNFAVLMAADLNEKGIEGQINNLDLDLDDFISNKEE